MTKWIDETKIECILIQSEFWLRLQTRDEVEKWKECVFLTSFVNIRFRISAVTFVELWTYFCKATFLMF